MIKAEFQHHYSSVTWSFRNHYIYTDLLLKKHFFSLLMLKTVVLLNFFYENWYVSGSFHEQKGNLSIWNIYFFWAKKGSIDGLKKATYCMTCLSIQHIVIVRLSASNVRKEKDLRISSSNWCSDYIVTCQVIRAAVFGGTRLSRCAHSVSHAVIFRITPDKLSSGNKWMHA